MDFNPALAVVLVAALAFSGCSTRDVTGPQTEDVSATDNAFTPNSLAIKENDKIVVKNNGQALHSVTIHKAGDAVTATKKDSDIAKGSSTDHTFAEAGTYHVYCKYHSGGTAGNFGTGMVLTVTVSEDS